MARRAVACLPAGHGILPGSAICRFVYSSLPRRTPPGPWSPAFKPVSFFTHLLFMRPPYAVQGRRRARRPGERHPMARRRRPAQPCCADPAPDALGEHPSISRHRRAHCTASGPHSAPSLPRCRAPPGWLARPQLPTNHPIVRYRPQLAAGLGRGSRSTPSQPP